MNLYMYKYIIFKHICIDIQMHIIDVHIVLYIYNVLYIIFL